MKRNVGYLLPEGDAFEDELACALVFYPDRPEYRRALLGSLLYLETWLAWETDVDKRAKDAAASWKLANEQTLECWTMACLESLQADVAAILLLLQNNVPCCGDNITYGDSTVYITTIVPGDGEPPDYYGETGVEDWEEWLEYLCYSANAWVDQLIATAETIELALSIGGLTVALVAYAIAAIAYYIIGGYSNASVTMLQVINMIAGYSISLFSDAADDIEAARDDIVCAILGGRDVGDAIEAALSSGDAWDLFYQHIDYESAMAILYEGGDGDSVFLDAEKDATCVCLCPHFESLDPINNPVIYQSALGCQFEMHWQSIWGFDDVMYGTFFFNLLTWPDFCDGFKVIDTISVSDSLGFTYLLTKDDEGQQIEMWGPDVPPACNYAITLLEDEAMQMFVIQRNAPVDDGCGTDTLTITMTYHQI